MSISGAFANARSGLALNARAAELVGSNIANALTPNHARQEIVATSLSTGGVGIDKIARASDPVTMAARLSTQAEAAEATTMLKGHQQIADLAGSNDGASGLAASINQLGISISQAAIGNQDQSALQSVVFAAQDVVEDFNDMATGLRALRDSADSSIADRVTNLNEGLQAIDALNVQIVSANARHQDTAALEEQREAYVLEISDHIPVSVVSRQNGQIALFSAHGATLLDGAPATFGFAASGAVGDGASISDGTVSGLTLNGLPVDEGPNGLLTGGGLAADFTMRDDVVPQAQAALDELAGVVLQRLESADDTLSARQGGLISDGAAGYDPALAQGLAARMSVNPALDGSLTSLTMVRDGFGSGADGSVLNALTAALTRQDSDLSATGDMSSRDLVGHISQMATGLNQTAFRAEQSNTEISARALSAQTAHAQSVGVDSDQQLQLLLEIENAYAANARVVATADAMMQKLLEL